MDEDKVYIKIFYLDDIYSFVVDNFLFEIILEAETFVTKISHVFLQNLISMLRTISDENMRYIKVIGVDQIYNFVMEDFFI